MADPAISVGRIGTVPAGGCHRVLVDRLWPRGVRKEQAPWDEWLKEIAPSAALRQWYGHDPARYEAFQERYRNELIAARDAPGVRHLLALAPTRSVALLTATADLGRSHVPVLADFLRDQSGGGG
jgi:uncharacterized protein YeaO (DUF488 family)